VVTKEDVCVVLKLLAELLSAVVVREEMVEAKVVVVVVLVLTLVVSPVVDIVRGSTGVVRNWVVEVETEGFGVVMEGDLVDAAVVVPLAVVKLTVVVVVCICEPVPVGGVVGAVGDDGRVDPEVTGEVGLLITVGVEEARVVSVEAVVTVESEGPR